ncbi:uncharacterized protein LOC127868558 isoform X2 [Dreissena polymorpha]|uniref:uncharacterized protein LOC127868558 isoform X2 n=1 Tax=Dreissena polymorpha TaxID=45954 RepID=UPI002263F210|nr:uncharacterized protein LOC127868558 isoform X2 [Dreissena polymorpha]
MAMLGLKAIFYTVLLWSNCQTAMSENATLTSDKDVVAENSSLTLTCYQPRAFYPIFWSSRYSEIYIIGTCQPFSSRLSGEVSVRCVNSTTYTLTLLRVDRIQDGDRWLCSIDINFEGSSNSIVINVHVPITELKLTPDADPVSLISNMTTEFTCTSDFGKPAPDIHWFINNGRNETSGNIDITRSSSVVTTTMNLNSDDLNVTNSSSAITQNITTSTLTFTPSHLYQNMRLFCTGNNGGHSVTSKAEPMLNILFEPTIPRIIKDDSTVLEEIETLSKEQLVLKCQSDGNPTPTYVWTYLGRTTAGQTITIPQLQSAHEVAITHVDIVCPNSQNLVIKDGEITTIECVTSPGKPSAIINWFKDNGTPETTADDIQFSVSDTNVTTRSDNSVKSILYYKAAQRDNNFRIYCTASNVGTTLSSEHRMKLDIIHTCIESSQTGKIVGFCLGGTVFGLVAGIVATWYFMRRPSNTTCCGKEDTQTTYEDLQSTNPTAGGHTSYTFIETNLDQNSATVMFSRGETNIEKDVYRSDASTV